MSPTGPKECDSISDGAYPITSISFSAHSNESTQSEKNIVGVLSKSEQKSIYLDCTLGHDLLVRLCAGILRSWSDLSRRVREPAKASELKRGA